MIYKLVRHVVCIKVKADPNYNICMPNLKLKMMSIGDGYVDHPSPPRTSSLFCLLKSFSSSPEQL